MKKTKIKARCPEASVLLQTILPEVVRTLAERSVKFRQILKRTNTSEGRKEFEIFINSFIAGEIEEMIFWQENYSDINVDNVFDFSKAKDTARRDMSIRGAKYLKDYLNEATRSIEDTLNLKSALDIAFFNQDKEKIKKIHESAGALYGGRFEE